MRINIVLILMATALLQVSASTYAQKITLTKNNASIVDIFKEIQAQSDYDFIYSNRLITKAGRININVAEASLLDVLEICFKNQPFTYSIKDRTIVIKGKDHFIPKKVIAEVVLLVDISGKVIDKNGLPVPGVSVKYKGSNTGSVTDAEGNYKINTPSGDGTLVFSSIGYVTQEVAMNNRTKIDIVLAEDLQGLEEVVVVGYDTQKKSDLTGAVSSISEKELQSRPVPSFQEAIMGRSSGIMVRQNGGDLDGKYSISIRGIGSVTGNNDPLIVVDGVPMYGAGFSTINPKDIVSIDILKDASSTAIYGSRASNGVILVSTKTPQLEKTQLTFSTDQGLEEITKTYKVLSSEQQRKLFVAAFKNSGLSTAGYENPADPVWQINTDWQDLGTRRAFRQSYNLGIRGGSDKTQFSTSISYLNREGTLLNSDIGSYSIRANVDSKITKTLQLQSNLTGSHQRQNVLQNDQWTTTSGYEGLLHMHTYTEPYDAAGNLTAVNSSAAPYFGANENPLIGIMLPTNELNQTRILGNVKLNLELMKQKQLVLSGNFGGNVLQSEGYRYLPVYKIGQYSRTQGSVTTSNQQAINWVSDLTLNFKKSFEKHYINALVGGSGEQFFTRLGNVIGTGTLNNTLNQLSNQTNFSSSGSEVLSGLLSAFVRLNYTFDNKYLFTGTIRKDGSSKFGPNSRYGTFPSASIAWRISEEKFLQQSSLISDLKLRASYGLTGNQNIADFAFLTAAGSAPYVFGNSLVIGNSPLKLGNPNLKWESAKQFDVGLDALFKNGRLSINIDYYDKKSDNLLIDVPIPIAAGLSSDPTLNIGSLRNSGFEFASSSKNIIGKVSWTTDFNFTYNKNKVLNIGTNSVGDPLTIPGAEVPLTTDRINLTERGRPVGSFYMLQFDGIWQLGQEAQAKKWFNAVPGDVRYKDLNNNGILDQGDKTFVGNPHPKFFGGLNNSVAYKNLSLSVFVNFASGFQIYNAPRNLLARAVPFVQNLAEVADFWTPENPSNKIPRPSQGGNTTSLSTRASTRFLEDGDFIRIKNVSFSYQLPDNLLKSKNIQSAAITLSGINLFTFTKYSGLDPEASSTSASLLSAGIDYSPYPLTRLFSLGVNVTF
ncbi:MAG: TonB-dependent receptor [Daejeonella sp.]